MISRLAVQLTGLLLALVLAGCQFQTSNLGSGNAELNAQAASVYTQVASRQTGALEAQMSRHVDRAQLRSQLTFIYTMVPEGQPPAPTVTGHESYTGTDARTYTVVQDYAYPDRINHVATRLIFEDEAWKVLSFNVNVTMTAQPAPTVDPAATEGST